MTFLHGNYRRDLVHKSAGKILTLSVQFNKPLHPLKRVLFSEKNPNGYIREIESSRSIQARNELHGEVFLADTLKSEPEPLREQSQAQSSPLANALEPLENEGAVQRPQGDTIRHSGQCHEVQTFPKPFLRSDGVLEKPRPENSRGAKTHSFFISVRGMGIDENGSNLPYRGPSRQMMIEDPHGNTRGDDALENLSVPRAAIHDEEKIAPHPQNTVDHFLVNSVSLQASMRNIVANFRSEQKT
jgi:hypothetical protein